MQHNRPCRYFPCFIRESISRFCEVMEHRVHFFIGKSRYDPCCSSFVRALFIAIDRFDRPTQKIGRDLRTRSFRKKDKRALEFGRSLFRCVHGLNRQHQPRESLRSQQTNPIDPPNQNPTRNPPTHFSHLQSNGIPELSKFQATPLQLLEAYEIFQTSSLSTSKKQTLSPT
jgi:hypothetical protein